ncbi:glycosyltransferase family 1 protein [Mariprofundus sp. EBB-1]|uniref:glycosyltransferase family 4 protein n=1 Tax=Mariprofundus sp. EBB-1 TaxID=2650971 RepID=UPI000EF22B48|nr:glycosyltransferase family 4 protein [Mariprofundus sp. EBB-1]RLL51951.1 glycosyltransferase family 1 protein [Mariprofundus sp. EBB-1]
MKKICLVASAEIVVHFFLIEPLRVLSREYDVTLVVNTDNCHFLDDYGLSDVRVIPVAIEREIKPLADLRALSRLIRLFRAESFDVVHSITPKAGLLAMLAAKLTSHAVRIHNLSGQVWVTRDGLSRLLLKNIDRMTMKFATHLLSDSQSQIDFLVAGKLVGRSKCRVLGDGSVAGVNIDRFKPDLQMKHAMRQKMNTPESAKVVLFLGRLKRDKGVLDLARAFALLEDPNETVWLWVVGPDEDGLGKEIEAACGSRSNRLRIEGYTRNSQQYFAAADLFCLPSYRESFGVAILEAAACGVPTVGSRIYGITDAVKENETGVLFNVGQPQSLSDAMQQMLDDDLLREQLGKRAMDRVHRLFSSARVTHLWVEFYQMLLKR